MDLKKKESQKVYSKSVELEVLQSCQTSVHKTSTDAFEAGSHFFLFTTFFGICSEKIIETSIRFIRPDDFNQSVVIRNLANVEAVHIAEIPVDIVETSRFKQLCTSCN